MKLIIRLEILLCNLYLIVLFAIIFVVIPLQFIFFLFKVKKKWIKLLEDKVFRTLFYMNDLRKSLNKSSDE